MKIHKTPIKFLTSVASLVIIVAIAPNASAQKKSPPKTKPQSTSVVMGTKQLPGEFGKIGTTYTIGKESPLNFTLVSSEYKADRFVGGEFTGLNYSWVPEKTQKLLVIHYTVQNPLPHDQTLTYQSWALTAVSADDQNSKMLNKPWIGNNTKYQDVTLKPGQKILTSAAFFVPAAGETPKLIVQRAGDSLAAVVRYDLRGKVAKLPATWSDDGFTPKDQIEMSPTGKYPIGGFDFAIASVEQAASTITIDDADRTRDQWVVKFNVTGVSPDPSRFWYGALKIRVKTDDGDIVEVRNYQRLLRAGRDEVFDGQIPVGETMTLRFLMELPKGSKPKTLTIQPLESDLQRRAYIYKVGS